MFLNLKKDGRREKGQNITFRHSSIWRGGHGAVSRKAALGSKLPFAACARWWLCGLLPHTQAPCWVLIKALPSNSRLLGQTICFLPKSSGCAIFTAVTGFSCQEHHFISGRLLIISLLVFHNGKIFFKILIFIKKYSLLLR